MCSEQVSLPDTWARKVGEVGTINLPWRQSSEYFTLNREHAELVTNDTLVNEIFSGRLCCDEDHDNRYLDH